MFANLHRDVVILMASRGVRAFAFSYLSVVFTIYLAQLGYSTVTIGLVVSTAYASGAVLTALWGFLSDRYGRKNILMLLAALTIVSNTIYVFFSHLFFILSAVIIANVGAGGSGAGGQGGGPMSPVEQALLAEKCTPQSRNHVFATNAFVGSSMGALGALLSGLPQYLQETWSWQPIASYKPLFLLTILFGVVLIFAYASIEEHHVPRRRQAQKTSAAPVSGFVVKMSLLGMVDNLGGGLISPLISYWFFLRYGVELKSLGFMFFLSYLLAALSFLVAPLLARRLGVVPTMAFSHGAASLIYLFLPLAPTFSMAAAMTILRSFLAYMDNPLRSSFIMGVVRPEDRGSAAGITSLSRHVPVAVSPSLSAYMMQSFSLNVPIFLGGFLQLFHDCVFYFMFRNVKPPEEQSSKT
ncbi:MAG: MFS transporter [Deltaproteobacteria bacterium]|nr:MFS transporter [Deltaproteobacteria bacterium]MBI3067315.1 MFS transporter [Deltaproteobacteria bacterium]